MTPVKPETRIADQDWSRGGPRAWLRTLQEHPHAAFYVSAVSADWIPRGDVDDLVAMMASAKPAATVCVLASAHAVHRSHQSTVGHEAALLVQAFRNRRSYPGSCSDLASVDVAALQEWWSQQRR